MYWLVCERGKCRKCGYLEIGVAFGAATGGPAIGPAAIIFIGPAATGVATEAAASLLPSTFSHYRCAVRADDDCNDGGASDDNEDDDDDDDNDEHEQDDVARGPPRRAVPRTAPLSCASTAPD